MHNRVALKNIKIYIKTAPTCFGSIAIIHIGVHVVHCSEWTVHCTHADTDLIKYAATPPNQPQLFILTDYFNNYNFSKLK